MIQDADTRAAEILSRMSLEDKLHMVHGHVASRYEVPALDHLGLPALKMTDGPSGVNAGGDDQALSTAFPSSLAVAATFDPELAQAQGAAIAVELLAHGMNVLLAPNLDVVRHPWWGRATEQYGEEPALIAAMGAGFVNGVQSQGVIANAKHFAAYGQETGRMQANDIRMDETTLREVYLAPFEHVVTVAGVDTVMSSFNRINGTASAESPLIQTVLKDEWGFAGWIMSDYGSLSEAVPAALAGFDQEMPGVPSEAGPVVQQPGYPGVEGGDVLFGGVLRRAIHDGRVPMARLDDMVRRILRTLLNRGLIDRDTTVRPTFDVAAHRGVARQVAAASLTLLHNQNRTLPLDSPASLVLIGADADRRTGTGGASVVARSTAEITPLNGLATACAARGVAFRHLPGADRVGPASMLPGPSAVPSSVLRTPQGQPGLEAQYWQGHDTQGTHLACRTDPQVALDLGFLSQLMNASGQEPPPGTFGQPLSARWTGTLHPPVAGTYRLSLTCMGSGFLELNGQRVLEVTAAATPTVVWTPPLSLDGPVSIHLGYETSAHANWLELGDLVLGWEPPPGTLSPAMAEAVQAAAEADVAVVFAHPYESEQRDRDNLSLPNDQDLLIAAVAAVNPRTVVVLSSGGPVLMPWLDQVGAVVQCYHPGQEGGAVLADALFGALNPSGRLPLTWPRNEADVPVPAPHRLTTAHTDIVEGAAVGHRAYAASGKRPLFAFGHGLGYTTFAASTLRLSGDARKGPLTAHVTVTNTGDRPGTEVVQIYQKAPEARGGWPRLVAFARADLAPGESREVSLPMTSRALSFWDPVGQCFALPEEILLGRGASSGQIDTWITCRPA